MNAELMGYRDYEVLDASSADATVVFPVGGRGIKADTAGTCKIQYMDLSNNLKTEVLQLNAGQIMEIRECRKLFNASGVAGGTDVGAYNTSGTLLQPGIKVVY